ncbi:MAG: GDSL-type esterase/lipase family protein [Clostridia bacterium]|nr:GDSL-type esterase/lipase family protein [Clostridia bacterium]
MFYDYKNSAIDFVGRWAEYDNAKCTTTPGAFLRFAFKGNSAVLVFNTLWNVRPYGHVWIQLDGGAKIEATIEDFIRVEAETDGIHNVTVIYKSNVEMHHRWHTPLVGKLSFKGFEADEIAEVEPDNRKTIEFVGDSITEGVLIDDFREPDRNHGQYNRPFQDDSTATYAFITAKNLNLRPLVMGYGAVGVTHGGCGGTVKAADGYPYCFEGKEVEYGAPDYILINHGANDRGAGAEKYLAEYAHLLDVIREKNPTSQLISLSAFCGAYHEELDHFIKEYNEKNGCDILYIDSNGWVPVEPLHPRRDGHKKIAENLTAILKEKFDL